MLARSSAHAADGGHCVVGHAAPAEVGINTVLL